MPRPSTVFSWAASGGAYIAAIPAAIRNLGFAPFSTSVAEWVNQALRDVGEWIGYIEAFFPADRRINVGRITGNGDPVGGAAGLFITTDGTGSGILLSPASGDDLLGVTFDGGDIRMRAGGPGANGAVAQFGVLGGGTGTDFAGLEVDHDALTFKLERGATANTSSLRYAYASAAPLDVEIGVSPVVGGYQIKEDASYGAAWVGFSPVALRNTSANAKTINAVRHVPIYGNVEADAAPVSRYDVVSLAGTLAGTATTKLQFVEVNRSTGAQSVLLAIDSGVPSDDNGGVPQVLDTSANWYMMRLTHATLGSGANTATVAADCVLTIRKYAVE